MSAKQPQMIRVFQTYSGKIYAYDAHSSRIFTIRSALIRETEEETEQAVCAYLESQKGIFDEPFSALRWEFGFEEYLDRISDYIPALELQLTCRCNLACDYCVYSGNYAHVEPHADRDMSWDTVRRSIDFYAAHSSKSETVKISFYGGEALLCFDLMQRAVAYAKLVFAGRNPQFRVTSNGVCLTEKVALWLEQQPDVRIMVTVNGPFHDQYRKTVRGEGSLSIIEKNLRMLREQHPQVWEKQIHFIANVARPSDYAAMSDYYREKIGRPADTYSHISSKDGNETIRDILRGDGLLDDEDALCRVYCKTQDPFMGAAYLNGITAIQKRMLYPADAEGFVGGCMPFLEKLYVLSDGRFVVCESSCDKLILGSLENGFDIPKLRNLYEAAEQLYANCCSNCWAQRLCTVCFKDTIEADGSLGNHIDEGFCEASRAYTLRNLKMYCELYG